MLEQEPQQSEPQIPPSRRIVVLTYQRPIEIVEDDWKKICGAEYVLSLTVVNINAGANLMVRRHVDGRFLVYGMYSVGSYSDRVHHSVNARHGVIVPNPEKARIVGLTPHPVDLEWASVVAAIMRVGSDLSAEVPEARRSDDIPEIQRLVQKCISKLPSQDLTQSGPEPISR